MSGGQLNYFPGNAVIEKIRKCVRRGKLIKSEGLCIVNDMITTNALKAS